ncbi:MAG: hypothetical protein F4202_07585 [Cenarchaeum sp. SB0677_bin_16]|nr:hypothetical protein [Cenarchaeum sp. SB0677_bin_16]
MYIIQTKTAKGMIPNSKQRKDTINRSKPSRRKAATLFNPNKYTLSDTIEGIFGAEETRGHQVYYRFVGDDNRKRFAKRRAIFWNSRVLNRFRWANRLSISITSYGAPPEAVYAIALPINILPVVLVHKFLLKAWHYVQKVKKCQLTPRC